MESDAECWERMLLLQRAYHCYKSARLEAAVEAMEMGYTIEEIPTREFFPFFLPSPKISTMGNLRLMLRDIASRLCLDLLNESLEAQLAVSRLERAYA